MRRALIALGLAIIASTGGIVVSADEPEETSDSAPPSLRGNALVTLASPWRWQIVLAPTLTPQIGALAASGLDVATGRAPAVIAVLGTGTEPPRWPYAVASPLPTLPAAPSDQRIAAAFGVTTFMLTRADEDLAMLELRVKYQDGLIATLNGIEVARSGLPRWSKTTSLAKRPHGPEWETFYIPVGPMLLRLGENTLALELHPASIHDAPSAAVELSARRDKGIVRGPTLAAVTATSAHVVVETDPDTDAVLSWGTSGLDHQVTSPPGRHHDFALEGLPTGAIRYRVNAGADQSAEQIFHTVPAAGATIRIGIYGDVRGGHSTHRKLVDQMFAEPLDLVAVTGDMVLRGPDIADWQRFFAITEPLLGALRYLPTIGNHDLGLDGAQIFALPPLPPDRPTGTFWYAYDYADVHLVFLDSNAYDARAQEKWLEDDLRAARARKTRAILAFTHDGPYSRGYHGGSVDARTRYAPILVRYGVDYLFSGHDHLYQRGEQDGLRYIVTGGGGASLYSPTCGVKGRRACAVPDGMKFIAKEHHFLVATIDATTVEVCARKTDGALLEPCSRVPLHK
ncbi:MAG TPA: metallophosphoesterase [Kofleriaceae bacterium]|jgi:3',5'-cyclic AMP phosphodiesterase CpdA